MSSKKFSFIWIDDDEDKVKQYTAVLAHGVKGFGRGANVRPLIVDKELFGELATLTKTETQPDLVLIDQVFTKVRNMPLKVRGSSIAHLLRIVWPAVPMVCISAALRNRGGNAFDQEDISEYTAVFDYAEFDRHIDDIYVIANDFPKIPVHGRSDLRDRLANVLGVPEVDRQLFMRALPEEFRNQIHETTPHRIAHWLFNVLLPRPGFLYDKLRVATFLGLTVEGFEKIAKLFVSARYKGPFAMERTPLWWISSVQQVLAEQTKSSSFMTSQEAGRCLAKVKPKDFSQCYVSGGSEIPNVVARLPASEKETAVCSRYTMIDPEDVSVIPGFETRLVIAGKK